MSVIDPNIVSEIIREAAQLYILPRYNALRDGEISTKTGPNDLVTQADLDVENHLKEALPKLLPASIFIGEEGVSSGEISLDALNDSNSSIWITDPVDGTYNFVHGKREFAVMVSLILNGIATFGWIYDVLADEMYVAERGSGAYREDVRLLVNNITSIENMSGHINPRYFPEKFRPQIIVARENFKQCQSLSCAGHEYLRILNGEAQFSVYSRHKPWDHIPGSVLLEEAGGYLGQWDGAVYQPSLANGGIIAASSENVLKRVTEVFMP